MKHHMIRDTALLVACVVSVSPTATAQVPMIRLAGTPEQIGTIWGEMNKEIIASDIEAAYLKRATAAGISRETLLKRSAASVRIIEEIAPHWLEEARAIARAAGVDEDLYVAYFDSVVRSRFLHEDPEECTSYAVSPNHARDGAIMFHKTRDNRDMPQAVYIVESSLKGINKFIAVSNATGILGFSMMVNEKGLAGAGDYARMAAELITEHYDPKYTRISHDGAPTPIPLDLPDLEDETLAEAAARAKKPDVFGHGLFNLSTISLVEIQNLRYRNMDLVITIRGSGTNVKECTVNGQALDAPLLNPSTAGRQHVVILQGHNR